jgi:hypothetical protein
MSGNNVFDKTTIQFIIYMKYVVIISPSPPFLLLLLWCFGPFLDHDISMARIQKNRVLYEVRLSAPQPGSLFPAAHSKPVQHG